MDLGVRPIFVHISFSNLRTNKDLTPHTEMYELDRKEDVKSIEKPDHLMHGCVVAADTATPPIASALHIEICKRSVGSEIRGLQQRRPCADMKAVRGCSAT